MQDREQTRTQPSPLAKKLMASFYENNRTTFALNLALRLALGGCDLAFSYMIMEIIDVAVGRDLGAMPRIVAISAAIILSRCLLSYFMRFTYARFLQRAIRQYRATAFEEILKKGLGAFRKESGNKYLSALTNDVNTIDESYLQNVFLLIEQCAIFVASLIIMCYLNLPLTICAIAFSVAPLLISLLTGNRLAKQERAISDQNERFVGMVKDLLTGFSVVKSFHIEAQASKQFRQENDEVEEKKYQRRLTLRLIEMFASVSQELAQFGVFLTGAYLAATGRGVTAGMITMFLQMMNYLVGPLMTVPPIWAARKATRELVKKIADALEEHKEEESGQRLNARLQSGIELKNLAFGYEPETPVLQDVSATFERGKSYAIIGASGSGKSTLLHLLVGGAEAYEGEIYYDGCELRKADLTSLYETVSMVEQNVFLFNDSVRNNITMYRDADEARLKEAIHMAGLDAFIEKNGLEYPCGEGGGNLSGGERQRIAIARSLLAECSVLMMDEAMSALDPLTAEQVTQSVLSLNDITRLVVTHRLEERLLSQYDQIVVMRGGTICESGSFAQLMEQRGYFHALYTVEQAA